MKNVRKAIIFRNDEMFRLPNFWRKIIKDEFYEATALIIQKLMGEKKAKDAFSQLSPSPSYSNKFNFAFISGEDICIFFSKWNID